MSNCNVNIAIVEPSHIVYEGLSDTLLKSSQHYRIYRFDSIEEIAKIKIDRKIDIIIANPQLIQYYSKDCNPLRGISITAKWIALVYAFIDQTLLQYFDAVIQITDHPEKILRLIDQTIAGSKHCNDNLPVEQLTDREIDVLIQLVHGLSNKEIADKLNISTHTVISHRKNISQKTGIKSQSGLTIYAISHKIISIDNLS
ncbi:MAG: response regulator transcription factor [Bacteroidales bacterium]